MKDRMREMSQWWTEVLREEEEEDEEDGGSGVAVGGAAKVYFSCLSCQDIIKLLYS